MAAKAVKTAKVARGQQGHERIMQNIDINKHSVYALHFVECRAGVLFRVVGVVTRTRIFVVVCAGREQEGEYIALGDEVLL